MNRTELTNLVFRNLIATGWVLNFIMKTRPVTSNLLYSNFDHPTLKNP
jgi:hypothetical protein